jgi:hypothetical protein
VRLGAPPHLKKVLLNVLPQWEIKAGFMIPTQELDESSLICHVSIFKISGAPRLKKVFSNVLL